MCSSSLVVNAAPPAPADKFSPLPTSQTQTKTHAQGTQTKMHTRTFENLRHMSRGETAARANDAHVHREQVIDGEWRSFERMGRPDFLILHAVRGLGSRAWGLGVSGPVCAQGSRVPCLPLSQRKAAAYNPLDTCTDGSSDRKIPVPFQD